MIKCIASFSLQIILLMWAFVKNLVLKKVYPHYSKHWSSVYFMEQQLVTHSF